MPEGDTIAWAANRIRPVLEGASPTRSALPTRGTGSTAGPSDWPGRAVTRIDTHGKHLFLRFEGDLVLHSHLGMTGAWGVYGPGRRWGRSPRRAWLVLRARRSRGGRVRRSAARARDRGRTRFDQRLAALGPDVLAAEFDFDRFLRRLREDDPTRRRRCAARPAQRGRDRERVEGRGLLGGSGRSVAGGLRASPMRSLYASSRHARRACSSRPLDGHRGRSKPRVYGQSGRPCPRCGTRILSPRSGRRQPNDILVPGMSDARAPARLRRVGHKGADLIAPGNTFASFDAARQAGVDMIEFDVLPERESERSDPRPRLRGRASGRAAHARGGARPPGGGAVRRDRARRRPQAARIRASRARRAARRAGCSSGR